MYIGPWQEYRLSQARSVRAPGAPALELKEGLEEALAQCMDPIAAQTAIQAVETFFARHPASQRPPRRPIPQRRETLRFPPVSSARSAGTASLTASSPLSVRSTQSEPMPSLKLPKLNIPAQRSQRRDLAAEVKVVASSVGMNSSNAPVAKTLDTVAMMEILRMQRRRKEEDAVRQYAGGEPLPTLAVTLPKKKARRQQPQPTLSKLEHIEARKQAFFRQQADLPASPVASSSTRLSPMPRKPTADTRRIDADRPPTDAVIVDTHISETELLAISKYFQQSHASRQCIAPSEQQTLLGRRGPLATIAEAPPPVATMTDELTPRHADANDAGAADAMPTELMNLDELHIAGIDGLIKWSAELQVEF